MPTVYKNKGEKNLWSDEQLHAPMHGSCQQWRAQGSCSSQTVWHTIQYIAQPHKREINKKAWLCTNCPRSRRKEGDSYRCCKPRSSAEFLCPCHLLSSDCIVTNFKTSISTYNHTSPPPQQLNSSILPVCNAFQCLIITIAAPCHSIS